MTSKPQSCNKHCSEQAQTKTTLSNFVNWLMDCCWHRADIPSSAAGARAPHYWAVFGEKSAHSGCSPPPSGFVHV